jgi:membrane-associated protease RseP (regulator of RpoE activity)
MRDFAADAGVPVLPPPAWPAPDARRWLVFAACLCATFVATTFFGAWHYVSFLGEFDQPAPPSMPMDLRFWLGGLWFSVSVLAILGAHEAGHYLACRHYGVDASLPYFLPAPLPLTGTFGAFIRIRGVIPHARALFDIGASGPFAGFVVAVPLLALGLSMSRVVPMPASHDVEMLALGEPLLYQLFERVFWGALPADRLLDLHPMARAAWFGLLATSLNLFPVAQLDGGHVAYAIFGRKARWITIGAAAVILSLTFVSMSWIAWAVLVAITLVSAGIDHPPTVDDHLPLGGGRLALGMAAVLVFALCFTPTPVEFVEPSDGPPAAASH